MNISNRQGSELLYVGFNQDFGCFACGTERGFQIYNVDPFKQTFQRVFNTGSIGIVEMLFRCNLLALVGGGPNPRYPPNKVMIWDDHQNRCIGELSFRSEVKAVKLRRDRVVVVLASKIYVYRFSDLKLLDQINTMQNHKGLVALCPDASATVLACPGISRGHVRVELYNIRKSTIIPAHEADLACLALSQSGQRLATASDRGTLVRVFDTHTAAMLHELRRGADRAEIYSIAFNQNSTFLACSSDKGTVHIFSLQNGAGPEGAERNGSGDGLDAKEHGAMGRESALGRGKGEAVDNNMMNAVNTNANNTNNTNSGGREVVQTNPKSGFGFLRSVVPGIMPKYFGSEWSFAQVRGLDTQTICAFGHAPNTIVVIGADGTFLQSSFAEGGECERIAYARFLRREDEMGDDLLVREVPPAPQSAPAPKVPTREVDGTPRDIAETQSSAAPQEEGQAMAPAPQVDGEAREVGHADIAEETGHM